MHKVTPSAEHLENAIYNTVKKVWSSLLKEHPENYYYFTLITSGEAHCPIVSAWSHEALEKNDPEVKWSYADSPYCGYKQEFFEIVEDLFSARPQLTAQSAEAEWLQEYELRLKTMESAIKRLDEEGLFGEGKNRNNIIINVEVMPPDQSNTERAKRLNPKLALDEWLKEAAE